MDRSLNEDVTNKIRKYPTDYNNNTRRLSPLYLMYLVRLGGYIVNLFAFYFYRIIGKLTDFLQFQEFSFQNRTVTLSSIHKSKWDSILAKVEDLRIPLNTDDKPLASRSHTHPSHSQTSRLLTSSLSLGVPVPLVTQCMWVVWSLRFSF
jgi:hypothetical protein